MKKVYIITYQEAMNFLSLRKNVRQQHFYTKSVAFENADEAHRAVIREKFIARIRGVGLDDAVTMTEYSIPED